MKKEIAFLLCLLVNCLTMLHGEPVATVGQLAAHPGSSVQVYDRQGNLLKSFLSAQQTYHRPLELDEIAPSFLLAVQAAEDRRFPAHQGIDWRAVLRAAWQNMRSGKVVSGASTLTQQVARLQSPHRKNIWGKIQEAYHAIRLEKQYSKDEILQQYVNRLEFGHHTQGIAAAAEFYFGVPAAELSVAQSALLAGLIQAPARLDPWKYPKRTMARRGRVLQAMFSQQKIDEETYQLAMREPLDLQPSVRPLYAPHFVRAVAKRVPDGAQVHTFLDADLQQYVQKVVRRQVAQLKEQHVTNGAVVVLDNQNGGILAYVGSADFDDTQHAGQIDGVQAKRQPGSALKPFVYGLALTKGWTAASILSDEDTFFEGGFRPRNYDKSFHGKVPLRRALACSYNVPVVQVAQQFGAAQLLDFLHQFGFASLQKSPDFYGLGLALGAGEVTLLELAQAYSALARGGRWRPAVWTENPLQTPTAPRIVLPAAENYILTDILSDNAARADAFGLNSPLQFPFPAAAKTGTSKDYKDNFAIGYTPRLTVAVWVGNFDNSPMEQVSGITGAAPILHDVLMYAQARYPGGEWQRPPEVVFARICSQSGLLAGEHCTHTREEIFTQKTVPTRVCDGTHAETAAAGKITAPADGDVYTYDAALPAAAQQIHVKTDGLQAPCRWQLNGEILPHTSTDFWWPLARGEYQLEVRCIAEQTASSAAKVSFLVL